jgi:hypothetical protein
MDAKTLKALKGSINKWKANAEIDYLKKAKINITDCQLCDLFWYNDCTGCPVMEKSKYSCCVGTPYVAGAKAYNANDLAAFIEASHAEVEFLQSLLPEPKP